MKSLLCVLSLFFSLITPSFAVSEADLLPVEQAYSISARALSADAVQITWQIAPGYYLYKHRFAVKSTDPTLVLGALQLPAGEKHQDAFFGVVETYRQQVSATVSVRNPQQKAVLAVLVSYQGCADIGVCYPPQKTPLRIAMPATPVTTVSKPLNHTSGLQALGLTASNAALLGDTDQALSEEQAFTVAALRDGNTLLVRFSPAPGYYLYQNKISLHTEANSGLTLGPLQLPTAEAHQDPHFGTVPVYFKEFEARSMWYSTQAPPEHVSIQVHLQGCKNAGVCYPPMQRTISVSFEGASANTLSPAAPTSASWAWLPALLLAVMGGLLLNLMPCVLPVLSFKAFALAQASNRGTARRHALWYSAGVMSSFALLGLAVLGLRQAGLALGWGFQLQQPVVVGVLALLLFAIGLMMSGVFHWGSGMAGMGQSLTEKSGPAGDFFTGVLAVVVASPCTAPFMANALAYAFIAPWFLALLVFLALGFGLALPFLLIGFIPSLAARLPKPGAWMNTLKHWLAFPMYFAAAWLAWVFGHQKGVNGLGLLLITAISLALALWWFETQKIRSTGLKKILLLLMLMAVALSFKLALQQDTPRAEISRHNNYEPFSAARLQALRVRGIPVFVDMTADWCITCKVNEKAVLHTDAFSQLLKTTGTVYLVGDWTNQDPEITAFLNHYKTPGVPLYVLYPRGAGEGRKLPQVLSFSLMQDALTQQP